jgi:hypothetical protein
MKRGARILPVLCCAAALPAWGCGEQGGAAARAQHPDGITVGLELRGEAGERRMLACSSIHNYAQFRLGREITYDGTVRPTPDGGWRVKVKIKRCVDGRFQDSGADRVPGVSGGRFAGQIQPPGKGVFFARARYRDAAGDVVSDKAFFEVR